MNRRLIISIALIFIVSLLYLQACSSSKKAASETGKIPGEIKQESVIQKVQQDSVPLFTGQSPEPLPDHKTSIKPPVDISQLMREMSLREKIGQLFFVDANGYFVNRDNRSFQKLVSLIQDHHVGGLIFFSGNVYGQAILANKLQGISKIPLWITQDMEYGAAMRIRGATRFTPAMGIAATQHPEYAYWTGKITAKEAKAVGVHQIFAPVLDVNNNPENPVINVRSYSEDPRVVTQYGKEFIKGVESEGLIATAKHFPGHGDTATDSHISLPVIDYNYARLDSIELAPFRAAIQNGLKSVMSAHISFPKLSDNPDIPGTLDRSILNRILIDSLDFNGMVITDGLEMNGISSHFSPGSAVVKALQAGADIMLLSSDPMTAIKEIEQSVHRGLISEDRIDKSVEKLLLWKKEYGLFKDNQTEINQLDTKINTRKHQIIADEISRKSVTLLRNKNNILPIRASKYPKILLISVADDESGSTGSYLSRRLRDYHPNVDFHVFDNRSSKEEKQDILNSADEASLILIGSFIFVRSGQKIQLKNNQLEFLKQLPDKPTGLIAFGNPYIVGDLPETDMQMLAWSAGNNQVRNTVPALFGGSAINGKLPISIPGIYPFGHGIDLPQTTVRFDQPETVGFNADSLQKVDRIMNEAVFDSTFPGGVVTVLKDGVIAYNKSFGYHTYDKTKKVEESDIYDLASLTKIIATTSAIMKLVDEKRIKLEDKVSKYIPEFSKGPKKSITIRNLLLHDSGLPPFRIYVDKLKKESSIIDAIKNEPLINSPGEKYVYSDLGFILLGEITEQITGTTLDKYLRQEFFYPLGMNSTFFNPGRLGDWMKKRIPPTEIDTVYRNKLIHAEVNDERAYYMNGVAGHAGLFSNARDLAVYAQMLLSDGAYAGKEYVTSETIKKFTERQSSASGRGYGFDHKSEGFSTAGSLASPSTYGHTGFTGTSLWIDPERNMAIIILTNRTYPQRSYGENISRVRAAIANAIFTSLNSKQ